MTKCIVLALVAINVIAAVSLADNSPLAQPIAKLVKNFAKINDYLEKNVDSDNLEANIEKADAWLKEKSKLARFFDKSSYQALQIFIWLPETISNVTACESVWSRGLLEICDMGLGDETRLDTKNKLGAANYPLKRIDRILETVGFRMVKLCRIDGQRPELKFTFKQLAYDHISDHLANHVSGEDPETNMKEAERLLQTIDDQEGSYAIALKQLLSLQTILSEDSCNEQGSDIILKNDLATRDLALTKETSGKTRISKIVHHYIVKHSLICHQVYQKNLLTQSNQLDTQTYRRVLTLANAAHLAEDQYAAMVEEVESKQVGDDFSNPSISKKDAKSRIFDVEGFHTRKLLRYLNVAAKQDPRSRFLQKIDEDRVVMEAQIQEIYNEYLLDPCKQFTSLMESGVKLFDYNWKPIKSSEEEQKIPLNFRMLRSAFYSCKDVMDCQKYYISSMLDMCPS